jgi:5-aminolevulinate synthase
MEIGSGEYCQQRQCGETQRDLNEGQQSALLERQTQQDRVRLLKRLLGEAGIPMLPSDSHIVPVLVGDPRRCRNICDQLMERFDIYVQPINYPTVPRGTERLRLTPGPLHSKEEVERFVAALSEVWGKAADRKVA